MDRRLYILGASGSGVSTLGRRLGEALGLETFDVDDYYWLPTDPPFQHKRPIEDRLALLHVDLVGPGWVLSGSLDGWGDAVADKATHVVFLDTDTATRLARLRAREAARFGARIAPGGDMEIHHEAFVAWAAAYDQGTQSGRNRPRHEAWLARRVAPVIRLDGARPVDTLVAEVLAATAT